MQRYFLPCNKLRTCRRWLVPFDGQCPVLIWLRRSEPSQDLVGWRLGLVLGFGAWRGWWIRLGSGGVSLERVGSQHSEHFWYLDWWCFGFVALRGWWIRLRCEAVKGNMNSSQTIFFYRVPQVNMRKTKVKDKLTSDWGPRRLWSATGSALLNAIKLIKTNEENDAEKCMLGCFVGFGEVWIFRKLRLGRVRNQNQKIWGMGDICEQRKF